MNPLALSDEEKFSVEDSSRILGLEPFCVYSLIHRRKLNADRTLLGELAVSRTELSRVLGEHAEFSSAGDESEV